MTRAAIALPFVLLLSACGGSPTKTLAPTAETITFLKVDAPTVGQCLDVEGVVVDAVAGMVTGNMEGAVQSQVRQGLDRCGQVARLIDPSRYPAAQRPRAESCRAAFAAKVDAYTGLSQALAGQEDFMAAQQGARRFMSRMGDARPAMERCNTAA